MPLLHVSIQCIPSTVGIYLPFHSAPYFVTTVEYNVAVTKFNVLYLYVGYQHIYFAYRYTCTKQLRTYMLRSQLADQLSLVTYIPYLSVLKPGSYTSRGSNIRRVVKLCRAHLNIVLVEMGRRARLYAGSKIIYKKQTPQPLFG